MSLTAEQLRLRDGKVTASFAPYLMAGDEKKILREWLRLVGDTAYESEDLSEVWAPSFGSFIEPFALDWHQRRTGAALTRRGEVVTHPRLSHVCCTLDAWRDTDACVIDCKAIGAWRKIDEACAFYLPQMVVQRGCLDARKASLLIVHGGAEPQEYPLPITDDYAALVWERIGEFWRCVEDLTSPVAMPAVAGAIPVDRWRAFDLDALQQAGAAWPNWAYAMQAEIYTVKETAPHAKAHTAATKAIKELLPDDVRLVTHSRVAISRKKNGAVTITLED